MKLFKNLKTGVIEAPKNAGVIEQYEKHTELYVEYKPKKKTAKEEKNTDNAENVGNDNLQ